MGVVARIDWWRGIVVRDLCKEERLGRLGRRSVVDGKGNSQ